MPYHKRTELEAGSRKCLCIYSFGLTSGITGFAIALSQIYRCPATFRSPSAQSPVHAFVRACFLFKYMIQSK